MPKSQADRLSPWERHEVCRLAREGFTVKQILKQFGGGKSRIYNVLKAEGIAAVNDYRKWLSDDEKNAICQRYVAGETMNVLAAEHGVSLCAVQKLLIARQLSRPPRTCGRCGTSSVPKRHRYCEACRTSAKNVGRELRWKAMIEQGLCPYCKQPIDRDRVACSQCQAKARQRGVGTKQKCMAGYGGKCACCGEAAIEFLSIDHVNNDGGSRRKFQGEPLGVHLYRKLIREGFPPGYQILCMNCNFAKGHFGYCPHQKQNQPGDTPSPG